MLLAYAQQLVDQEQRVQAVEARVHQIEQRSIDVIEALNVAPTEPAPSLTERDSLRKLINAWCRSNNADHQEAWRTLYSELYIRDGFSVNARIKNSKATSKLELVAEHGKLGIFAIAMFKSQNGEFFNGKPANPKPEYKQSRGFGQPSTWCATGKVRKYEALKDGGVKVFKPAMDEASRRLMALIFGLDDVPMTGDSSDSH
jgi:hypothetical protein